MKTHFASVELANESDNNDYWSGTICGIEETESPLSDKWNEVSCKKCLKRKEQHELNMKVAMEDSCDDMGRFNEFMARNPQLN